MKKWLVLLICIVMCGCSTPSKVSALEPEAPAAVPSSVAAPSAVAPTDSPSPEPIVVPTPAETPSPAPTTAASTPQATVEPVPSDTQEPTPEPTPDHTPEPTPEPEPTKDPNRPMVALTFDDGPHSTKTAPLLDMLEQYHVKATFFVLGTSISDETAPLLQRMLDMGCEIGIHGLNHGTMTRYSQKTLDKQLREMKEILAERLDGYTPRLMRPPGGHCNPTVKSVMKDLDLSIILWSVDTLDWKNGQGDVLRTLRSHTKDGAIILCHDKGHGTLAALKQFIPQLLEQGYDLVTVSELLSRNGVPAQPGVVYTAADPVS